MLFERALEVRLVGKPRRQRHIGDQRTLAQLRASELDALVDQEGMGCQPVILLEGADQVRRRQFGRQADVFQFQPFGAVRADVLGGPFQLVVDLAQRGPAGLRRCCTSLK